MQRAGLDPFHPCNPKQRREGALLWANYAQNHALVPLREYIILLQKLLYVSYCLSFCHSSISFTFQGEDQRQTPLEPPLFIEGVQALLSAAFVTLGMVTS